MSYSKRFKQLEVRLHEIEKHLLPEIKINGNYTKKELDTTRAYCLLSHAEIEAFFEDLVKIKVDLAVSRWKKSGKRKISIVIFFLAAYCDKAPASKSEPPENLVHIAHNRFKFMIMSNNGIKQANIDSLFGKIGYEMDTALSATLNSFGVQRGEFAHTSIKTQQTIDPLTEKKRLVLILVGLKNFTKEFSSFSS